MHETYGANPKVYPERLEEAAAAVPQTLARVEGTHEENWARACRGEDEATSPFEYAGALTEVMLLGLVALRTGQGRQIHYDGESMRVTNAEEANRFLVREYRRGWEVR